MFFRIDKHTTDRFAHHYSLPNGFVLGVDEGWQSMYMPKGVVYYKGYSSDRKDMQQIVRELCHDPTPRHRGNFCVIVCNTDSIILSHDRDRSFPLWHDDGVITNLEPLPHHIWANSYVVLEQGINTRKIPRDTVTLPNSYQLVLERLHRIICETYENFLTHNTRPLKIFISGGIDTTMCYSYLKKFTKRFEVVDYEYKKFTHFYRKNWHHRLQSFWAYRQIHSWGEQPVALVTGGCGDEYFMRGPSTADLYLRGVHDTCVNDLLEGNKESYMYDYLTREKNQREFRKHLDLPYFNELSKDKEKTILYVMSNLANDHQHWHIDNTLTFTPWKNTEIPRLVMSLPLDHYKKQLLDAQINKDLIIMNNPDDLSLLSKFKNRDNFENLK